MRRPHIPRRLTLERRRVVRDEVAEMSIPSTAFYVMVAISSTIAAYGLLANSTAVVIGAMLVAPLMGPIFGIALGLAAGDRSLLGRAAVAEVAGMALVVLVGLLIGLVPLRLDLGAEIHARIQPTLYDIIVALAAGLAGAYALIDERVSPALPGVAVAVAVVPPLATCGLCLSAAKWDWALGAFLLFVANFLAIEIAAAVVFSLAGMVGLGAHRGLGLRQFIARFWISLVLFAGVAVLLTHTLVALVSQRRLQRSIETVLADELRSTAGAQLSGTTVKFHPPRTEVIATVVTPVALEAHQVAQMQDLLRRKVGGGTDLILRSLISKDFDAKGPVFVPPDEAARKAEATSETTFLNQATSTLTESLKGVLGAHLSEVRRERQGDRDVITAVVRTPQVIQPNQVAEAESAVQRATGASVHLVVRSILARDADDRGYLYQPAAAPEAPLPPEQRQVRDHVRGALERRLPGLAQGAYVTEVRYVEADSRLRVLAVARTPTPIGPGKVAQLQEVLRRWVDPGIDLTVRSDLGADAAASGYLANLDDRTLAPASPAAR